MFGRSAESAPPSITTMFSSFGQLALALLMRWSKLLGPN